MIGKTQRIRQVLWQRRKLLLTVALLVGIGSGLLAYANYRFSAVAMLVATDAEKDSHGAGEMASLLQQRLCDPEVLKAACMTALLDPKLNQLPAAIRVRKGALPGSVEICVRMPAAREALALANALAEQAVAAAPGLTATSEKTLLPLYEQKLIEVEKQLTASGQQMMSLQKELGSGQHEKGLNGFSKHREELETKLAENESLSRTISQQVKSLLQEIAIHHPAVLNAQQALDRARLRYTEDHPKVEELRLTLAAVRARVREQKDDVDPEIALNGNPLVQGLYSRLMTLHGEEKLLNAQKQEFLASLNLLDQKVQSLPEQQVRYARAKADYQLWNNAHDKMLGDLSRQQLLASTARVPFAFRKDLSNRLPSSESRSLFAAWVGLAASAAATMGFATTLGWAACRDLRIHSGLELASTLSAPVLGQLPDLEMITLADQENRAFQLFAQIKAGLSPAAGGALICGFTSSRQGEGRSTWIRLLAGTARKQGFQVLVIATTPAKASGQATDEAIVADRVGAVQSVCTSGAGTVVPFTTESLSSAQVFTVPTHAAWNLETRSQWQQSIEELKKVPNRVILVEFPPASAPETVLLGQNFPNLIWVCGRKMATAPEIQTQVQALQSAQVKVVGTVLNFAQT